MKPTIINNIDLANNQSTVNGEVEISSCERLTDFLLDGEGQFIRFQVQSLGNQYHLPSMQLKIAANLITTCQRCLEPMVLTLDLSFDYVLSDAEPEPFDGDDEVDWIPFSREMNVKELIEDELLIAMPLAPTHDNACKPSHYESGEKHHPFNALKNWQR